jgi:hypothetical protein
MGDLNQKALKAAREVMEQGRGLGMAVKAAIEVADLVERSELEALKGWRCYWCDAVFTDRAKAEIHFGKAHSSKPAPECYAMKERELCDIIIERDEARQEAEEWKKDAEERLPRHVYQEICDLNASLAKQLAALREAASDLMARLKHYHEKHLPEWGTHEDQECEGRLFEVLTDTEEAAAQWQLVDDKHIVVPIEPTNRIGDEPRS